MRYVGQDPVRAGGRREQCRLWCMCWGRRIYGRLYGPWVGLLAATLVAFAVIHVQTQPLSTGPKHFHRPAGAVGSFWAMLQVLERRRLQGFPGAGRCWSGLAFTPKVSILPHGCSAGFNLTYYFYLVDGGVGTARLSGLPRAAVEQTFLHCLAALAVSPVCLFHGYSLCAPLLVQLPCGAGCPEREWPVIRRLMAIHNPIRRDVPPSCTSSSRRQSGG